MLWVYLFGLFVIVIGCSVFFGAPYVPSHRKDVRRLFDECLPNSEETTVLDIGSGDGLVLREASKRGVRAIGYEIHPLFVGISKILSWGDERVSIRWVNAWAVPFPDAVTFVYIFSVGRDGPKLARKVQAEANRLGRPLTLACYGNALPDREPTRAFEAYYLYVFEPLHLR